MIAKFFAAIVGTGAGIAAAAITIVVGLMLLFLLKILLLGALVVAAFYLGRMAGLRMYWRFLHRPQVRSDPIIV